MKNLVKNLTEGHFGPAVAGNGAGTPGGFTSGETASSGDLCVSAPSAALPASPRPECHLVAMTEERSLPAEKFRMLANRLVSISKERQLRVVQVTSSVVGEGKSTVAANLAVTLARRPNERVLLLEGDLHKPNLSQVLGVKLVPGLGEWWDSSPQPNLPPLYRINDLRLWFLPAGSTQNAGDMLLSPRIPVLVEAYSKAFDWVVVDSPPLLPLVDAALWARWADGMLLVVRAGMPAKGDLHKGLESLDKARLVGVVLNEAVDKERVHYYDQYYGHTPEKPASASPSGKKTSTSKIFSLE